MEMTTVWKVQLRIVHFCRDGGRAVRAIPIFVLRANLLGLGLEMRDGAGMVMIARHRQRIGCNGGARKASSTCHNVVMGLLGK